MQRPIDVSLPHKLGKQEAKRRLADNVDKLEKHIPGGARVEHGWTEDRLNLTIHAMGQAVKAELDIEESQVRCHVLLPGMLALFAAPIEAMLQKKGNDLLLEDKR